MWKKIWFLILGGLCLLNTTFALPSISDKRDPILTNDSEQIIIPPEENAIREWTHDIIHSAESDNKIDNLLESNEKIETQGDATKKTINLVHRIINYALGLASVVALIVLIYAGIQMTTAAGDDKKYQAGKSTLKSITIGIIGIGISWLIVSFIFWLLNTMTKGSV